MKKEEILKIVLNQRKEASKKQYIKRAFLLKDAMDKKDPFVRVFSGVRRCGKSTLLQMIRRKSDEQDYFLNFDDERLIDFQVPDFQKLYEVFLEQFGEQKTFYFDEIQNIHAWERFVRRIHDSNNKVYVTGSNANLLSRELGTHLTGRYIKTEVYPFSFAEFLKAKKQTVGDLSKLSTKEDIVFKRYFNQYLKQGGFPEYFKSGKSDYLKHIYESIIYRDIAVRHQLPQVKTLKQLSFFCASNIAKPLSFNQFKKMFGVGSGTTIKEYFDYFEDSYLFFTLNKHDYSLKKQAYAPKKVYCIDNRLAAEVGFRFTQDEGRFLENVVFLELKRRAKDIFYHKNKKECDFVLTQGLHVTEAIQVSKSLEDEATRKRELEGLLEAMEVYDLKEGLILTENEEGGEKVGRKKIKILPIWKWMLLGG